MSGFSADWLTLREGADHRSRDARLLSTLAEVLAGRSEPEIVDIGCGTGSNLRAAAPALGSRQRWTLVDHDAGLLAAAREKLSAWADRAESAPGSLVIHKDGKIIRVGFRQADLARDLDFAIGEKPDVVTASALFDLCSAEFIAAFARSLAARGAVFHTVLTYNGLQAWTPEHAADRAMLDAFHAHQTTDKGFGRAAGPEAPRCLREAFLALGYRVEEADTPWVLGDADAGLVGELQTGFAGAVSETGKVAATLVAAWSALPRSGCIVGHTDTLAIPG
jgi:SAM-dependent methyltransferase